MEPNDSPYPQKYEWFDALMWSSLNEQISPSNFPIN
jgi:hypothetical protein